MKVYVPDTSVIVDGRITEMVNKGNLKDCKIVIANAVIAELEHQANMNQEIGFSGLIELENLKKLADDGKIEIEYMGKRPTLMEIEGAKSGMIDSKIREATMDVQGTLITSDRVQHYAARATGTPVLYLQPIKTEIPLSFRQYLAPDTTSLHFKENVQPMAKIGRPGESKLVSLDSRKMTREELLNMSKEIVEAAKRKQSYIDVDSQGATVVQVEDFRIVIARPPFSDGVEITIVRPIAKMHLDGYNLSKKLIRRLNERAEGIVICGAPGAGKSTFTAALAEFYKEKGKIVKTMESPRDLQVSEEITQYSPLDGSFEKTSDVLLLVRPDYTIYDEMRRTEDFRVYADMRMAGVGMAGVVHASQPIDAIQRFLGRVEMGIIPQIVDTVIYIDKGQATKVYEMDLVVRVPTGMTERDLSRPVIEVKDFETGRLEYELYKFGEETVVLKVGDINDKKYARIRKQLEMFVGKRTGEFRIELENDKVNLYVPEESIPWLIGKKGKNVMKMEQGIGMKIDVKVLED